MSTSNKLFEIVQATSASEFLELISPIGKPLKRTLPNDWLFRGEDSNEYPPLVPKAVRESSQSQLVKLSRVAWSPNKVFSNEFEQIHAEYLVLYHFFVVADRAGMPIPEDRRDIRNSFANTGRAVRELSRHSTFLSEWIPNSLLSLAGLAQHYGLPTRLLDWSRSHLTAAFFACKPALEALREGTAPDGKLASVWALDGRAIRDFEEYIGEPSLDIITAPSAMIPNLNAQDGLFTHWRHSGDPSKSVDRRPLCDQLLDEDYFADYDTPVFYRFELPYDYVEDLFRLLLNLEINSSKLYPGFDGVTESVREVALAYPD